MDAPDYEKMGRIVALVQGMMAMLAHLVNWMSGVVPGPQQSSAILLARARYAGEKFVSEHGIGEPVRSKLLDWLETVRELDSCRTSLASRSGADIERYLVMANGAESTLAEIVADLGYQQR